MQPINLASSGSQNVHAQRTFRDIVNIGPHCLERFIDSTNAPEIKALDIELAGCSNLSGTYQVGRVTPPNHTIFLFFKRQRQNTHPVWRVRTTSFKCDYFASAPKF